MFRIRRIFDFYSANNVKAIKQIKEIIREQFAEISERKINKIDEYIMDPLKYKFKTIIFVSENMKNVVKGFALLMYAPDLNFCYLDYIAVRKSNTSGGIGSSIYEEVRKYCKGLEVAGLFFECLPDDEKLCKNPEILQENRQRLRFYERYGAKPIVNTQYETPLKEGEDNPPYLVYDNLGNDTSLPLPLTKKIVEAILKRKYGDICSKEYIDLVIQSFKDDPVKIRENKYYKTAVPQKITISKTLNVIVNDIHEIHNVREKGYVESPVRIESIWKKIKEIPHLKQVKRNKYSEKHIYAIHDRLYVDYLKRVIEKIKNDSSIYPYVFPIRNKSKPPKELEVKAGYFCIDTFTPINKNAYSAAITGVNCSLTGADCLLAGEKYCYVLTRPPGHHAERSSFGGFCYFNNVAIAANYLSNFGKVAILDIDYHHGNGQQDIFYHRNDVFTLSIHGHPSFAYPYFSGFKDEIGEGVGIGYNFNIPLEEKITAEKYLEKLSQALLKIKRYKPEFLLVALGLDTAKNDPTGTWELRKEDFKQIGNQITALKFPTLIIQEGGYDNRSLGNNAKSFFEGLLT